MYLSASHIDIKKNQDYADFSKEDNYKSLILCDGIGEFEDSRFIAEFVVERMLEKQYMTLKDFLLNENLQQHKDKGVKAGTTIIQASLYKKSQIVKIGYLGDGGIIHLPGDFGKLPHSEHPYRYNEIMLPHNSPDGALTRHISHHSTKNELTPGEIDLKLNHPSGDILLLFTDGISTLDEKVILKDDVGRFWRNEPETIQFILKDLDKLLKETDNSGNQFQEALVSFNKNILQKLKDADLLQDDASLGIIITARVLEYYKNSRND